MTTSGKLMDAARTFGWKHQGLFADRGRVHKDFFTRGSTLIVVTYNVGGHIAGARRSGLTGEECLGTRVADKVNRVVTWFRIEDK